MARTLQAIVQSLIRKLPTGFALGRRGGVLDKILLAAASLFGDAEADAEQLMTEIDPRTANALLPDFERVLGPDHCGRDQQALTVAQRQRLAHQRWTAQGGQSIPYMVDVAAKLGFEITITEFWPSKAGGLRAGQRLRPEGSQFVWLVNLPGRYTAVKFRAGVGRSGQRLGRSQLAGAISEFFIVTKFRAGVSRAKHRLGSFEISALECELRRIKPAHTHVVFNYGAS